MQLVKIEAYKYEELSEKAKSNAIAYLDGIPFDYEDDEGNLHYEYFSDWNEADRIEFCEMNNYLFNKYGKLINNLIVNN